MKRFARSVGAVTALVVSGMVLSACATLNEDECLTANWQQLGQSDGMAGRPSNYVSLHHEACSKHGVPVNDEQWQSGWQVGIRLYCTPQNGLQVGRAGQNYANSCPADLAPEFLTAYQVGKRVADARKEIEQLKSELEQAKRHMEKGDANEKVERAREVEQIRTRIYGAELRLQLAEANYDRYLAGAGRDY